MKRFVIVLAAAAWALSACTSTAPEAAPSTSASATESTESTSSSAAPTTPAESSSAPAPESTSPEPTVAPGDTALTFTVTGCDACTISAIQVGPQDNYLPTPFLVDAKVVNGKAELTVPTKYTSGMYFTMTCDTGLCNSSNAQPVVVLRYPDQAVGAQVSDAIAGAEKTASMCWAGTTDSRAGFSLTTTVFADEDMAGNPSHSIRVWASPQVDVVAGTDSTTYAGGLGAQSYLHC
ncbi:unannotated protein [freshwater metagenome]|uniref:Unannotated protein n=1 Tax=freshwater metagenome TaxID=449393 RepID=A0A6J7KP50_9ZZZZ